MRVTLKLHWVGMVAQLLLEEVVLLVGTIGEYASQYISDSCVGSNQTDCTLQMWYLIPRTWPHAVVSSYSTIHDRTYIQVGHRLPLLSGLWSKQHITLHHPFNSKWVYAAKYGIIANRMQFIISLIMLMHSLNRYSCSVLWNILLHMLIKSLLECIKII